MCLSLIFETIVFDRYRIFLTLPCADQSRARFKLNSFIKAGRVTFIREYRKALHAGKRGEAKRHYKILLGKYRETLGPAVDTINYAHHKLYPQDLLKADRERTEAMIAVMTTTHYRQFKAELGQLETDPALWERYIGEDKAKKVLFQKLCKWRDEHAHYDHMTDGAKHLIHPWADDSRPGRDRYARNDNGWHRPERTNQHGPIRHEVG